MLYTYMKLLKLCYEKIPFLCFNAAIADGLCSVGECPELSFRELA